MGEEDEEGCSARLMAAQEMQMLTRTVIMSHSCEVKGNGRRAIFTADDAQYIIALIIIIKLIQEKLFSIDLNAFKVAS